MNEALRDRGEHAATTVVLERAEWHQQANCRGAGTAVFFPETGTIHAANGARAARRVCIDCPVFEECAAQGAREVWGVWAGVLRSSRKKRAAA